MIKQSFNDCWEFALGSGSAFAALAGGAKEEKRVLTLPHDASIELPRKADHVTGSGNGFFSAENCCYTKTFSLPDEDRDKSIWLEFEGVYQNAFVYVNGSFAAKHPYGYGNFMVDITRFVRLDEPNTIRVLVKNAGASGRWYTGGGIFRNVHLMVADRLHLAPQGAHISTISLEPDLACVQFEYIIDALTLGTRDITVHAEILDMNGTPAAENSRTVTVLEGAHETYRQMLYVHDPLLWSAEFPSLYQYRITLLEGETVIDTESGTFGIRMLQLDPEHGLRVNGKTVKLRGGCIHHDNGVIGTAEFAHAEEFRIRELKAAGYNAIRSSHNPASPTLLTACDKIGMYVMNEFSDVWMSTKVDFDYGTNMVDWWETDIRALVNTSFNHPSVIMYSIGNEIPENGNRFDVQMGKKLSDLIHSLDSTRYTTNSINILLSIMDKLAAMMPQNQESGEINSTMSNLGEMMDQLTCSDIATAAIAEAEDQVDIVGLNYAAKRYELEHTLNPNRIVVGSETYAGDLAFNWDLVERLPYVIGDFSWTAWDYLGEAGIGKISYGTNPSMMFYSPYPTKAAYCGDFNLLGDRRPVSYWREIIWGFRDKPYLCVQPPMHHGENKAMSAWCTTDALRSWNWDGFEGKPVTVEVYAAADEVELLLNGRSIEKKPIGTERAAAAAFELQYEPGELKAIAYRNGVAVSEDILVTASSQVHIDAVSDVYFLPADGHDIGYIELSMRDDAGILNPAADQPVTVQISGPGLVLGYGSADPESEENYYDTTACPYEGRLRAAIRATGIGNISVRFSADGLEDAVVEIPAR